MVVRSALGCWTHIQSGAVAVVQVGDDVHDILRDFANANGVTQVQLVAALIRRLHQKRIDVAEAVEEARAADTDGRRR